VVREKGSKAFISPFEREEGKREARATGEEEKKGRSYFEGRRGRKNKKGIEKNDTTVIN